MRRIVALICALALLALGSPAGLAATGDAVVARSGMDGFDDYVEAFCAVGDMLWMLGGSERLYAYDGRTGELTTCVWDEEVQAARRGAVRPDGETLYRSVAAWFAWNGAPHALVRTSTGRGETTDAALCRVAVSGETATLEPLGGVDWEPLLLDEYLSVNCCCAVGDVLCVSVWTERGPLLCLVPLDGSGTAVTRLQCDAMCPYEGELLVLSEEYDEGLVSVFTGCDPVTGETRELARLEGNADCIAQEPGSRRILFVGQDGLCALDPDSGAVERLAGVPIDVDESNGGACACVLDCGLYATGTYNGVVLRRVVDREAPAFELVVAEAGFCEAVEQAALDFERAHPGISLIRTGALDVLEQLTTRSDAVDVYVLHNVYGDPQALEAALERGWAAEIDSAALRAAVAEMYPALAERFMPGGRLVAVPLSADAMGLGLSVGAMKALGLSLDDVPANWPEFLDFIGALADNGRVPLIWPDDGEQVMANLIERIFEDFALEIACGTQQRYDTPQLRAALEAVKRLDLPRLAEKAGEIEGWEENVLLSPYMGVGVNGERYADLWSDYPLRLSIAADSPVRLPLRCSVAFVNPSSGHVPEAVALLEAAMARVDANARAMLSPAHGAPLHDDAAYARETALVEADIADLKAQIAAGGNAQAELEEKERLRAEMEDWYWITSAESLAAYRAKDGSVMLENVGLLENMRLTGLIWRYIEGGMDLDALIREVDRQAQMEAMEGY